MKTITFFGEIGADLFAVGLAAELKDAGTEDILMKFSSIGGSIFEGGDIYNVLSDHKRDNPTIKMTLEVKSIAASMGSLLAASPVWDDISVEQNTMLMLHNPISFVIGDFTEMRKSANFLESARDMYSEIYGARSGKGIEEIKEIMNVTTWYFGEEIITAGFADRMLEEKTSQVPQDKVVVMMRFEAKFEEMKKRLRDKNTSETFDSERGAAFLRAGAELKKKKNNPRTRQTIKTHEGKLKIKTDFSEKYPEIHKKAVQDGIKKEHARITALINMKNQPEFKGLSKVAAAFDRAVAEGVGVNEVHSLIMEAILKIRNDPAKAQASADESPPDICAGKDPPTIIFAGSGNPTQSSLLRAAVRQESVYSRGQPEIDIPGAPPRWDKKYEITEV